jgi:hypothetical protein
MKLVPMDDSFGMSIARSIPRFVTVVRVFSVFQCLCFKLVCCNAHDFTLLFSCTIVILLRRASMAMFTLPGCGILEVYN